MSLFTSHIASPEQVEVLEAIYNLGPWDNKQMLMEEALEDYPGEFGGLTPKDADRVIAYGNEVIVDGGYDPITPASFAEGKCEDLWTEDDVDETDLMIQDQFLEQSMDAHDILAEMEFDEPDDEEIPF